MDSIESEINNSKIRNKDEKMFFWLIRRFLT